MSNQFSIKETKVVNKPVNTLVTNVNFDPFTKKATGSIGVKFVGESGTAMSMGMAGDWVYQEPFSKDYLNTADLDNQIKTDAAAQLAKGGLTVTFL